MYPAFCFAFSLTDFKSLYLVFAMKHYTVIFEPDDKTISIHAGATILEAAEQSGIILSSVCGCVGTCGKCTVILQPQNESVLACQHHIDSDLTITIPQQSRFFQQQILEYGIDKQIKVAPCIRKELIKADSLNGTSLESILAAATGHHVHHISPHVTEQIETIKALTHQNIFTAVCHRLETCSDAPPGGYCYNLICLEPGDTTEHLFGIAIDIGTTTIVAKLLNMSNGSHIATIAIDNPQIKYGDDVISRIAYAETQEHFDELHDMIIDCVNSLITGFVDQTQIDPVHIYEISVAANTTMNHIFLNFPITQLGQIPYEAFSLEAHDRNARQMGLKINPCGNIHTIENIAGFVGSDTTAVALAVDMVLTKKISLVVDIGTNGELVLGTRDKMYAASCAAGPAFEGARITQGGRAATGAIERVIATQDDIDLDVIGGGQAISICGSGLIDAVAVLLDFGIVDSTGRFAKAEDIKPKLSEKIAERLTQQNGQGAFILAHNKSNGHDTVILNQADIRQVQLAKAAIRAGIILLQKKMGIDDAAIEQVLLAGAFGNYIQRESALRIGLLPDIAIEKIHFVGNAAGTGAQMILLSEDCRTQTADLVSKIEYIEIANQPDFHDVFTDSLMF